MGVGWQPPRTRSSWLTWATVEFAAWALRGAVAKIARAVAR